MARKRHGLEDIQRRDIRVFMKQPRKRQADIVLCIDVSGSMGFRHKLTYARLAAASLARNAIDQGDRVGIIDFDDLSKTLLPLGSSKNDLMTCISQVHAGGNTNIGDGIETAARLLLEHTGQNEKHIVLITDGLPSAVSRKALDELEDSEDTDLTEEYAILETRRALSRGIRTSVVHIVDSEGAGDEFIQSMAGAGMGKVTRIESPDDLVQFMS